LVSVLLAVVAVVGMAVVVGVRHRRTTASFTASVSHSGGWTTSASTMPGAVMAGSTLAIETTVSSSKAADALVDVEVYAASGVKVYQAVSDNESFPAGTARTFMNSWAVPATEGTGAHWVKIGIFGPGWGPLQHWNNAAATFTVGAPSTPGATSGPTTASSAGSTAVASTGTSASTQSGPRSATVHFSTLPPGSSLPSDDACAAEVRAAREVRPGNAGYNSARGRQKSLSGPYPTFARVDGDFAGTTDEILQWAACKWGIDEDIVRAQAAVESWWKQANLGDWGNDPAGCAPNHPIGSDRAHPGQCPQSVGILQVRYPYWTSGFPEAETSTAYNADYAYAQWRACFDGEESWLNTVDHVGSYHGGDLWGCIGVWYSGRWHTNAAEHYVDSVKAYLAQRIWTAREFTA
jgi:hypothetical protein